MGRLVSAVAILLDQSGEGSFSDLALLHGRSVGQSLTGTEVLDVFKW